MLLTVAFPILDQRSFLSEETHRLRKPTFPVPEEGKQFLRSTGPVRARARGGSRVIGGEDVYCGARGALRFGSDANYWTITDGDTRFQTRLALRRFYHGGGAIGRFEFGFAVRPAHPVDSDSTTKVTTLINQVLAKPVRVCSSNGNFVARDLHSIGPDLALHYLLATTEIRKGKPRIPRDTLCCQGLEPVVLLEKDKSEPARPPKLATPVALPNPGISLSYVSLPSPIAHQSVGCWVLAFSEDADLRQVRQLRMHLIRSHAEVACFRQVIRNCLTGQLVWRTLTPATDSLLSYQRQMQKLISKERRYGTPQKEILNVALESHQEAKPGSVASLIAASKELVGEITMANERARQYQASSWEKKVVVATCVGIIGLIAYLVIRNEPFADPNLVVLVRVILSLSVAMLGAIVPGFLNVSWKGGGFLIRAGGALALFVITFLLTPKVVPIL